MWSDYASMCVRTGGDGPSGLSVLLVPLKNQKGVSMRKIPVMGGTASGTTYIELDDVKVPVENILGKEGEGMKYIMVSCGKNIVPRSSANACRRTSITND
jgi:acyl-CoA dehydrogenase